MRSTGKRVFENLGVTVAGVPPRLGRPPRLKGKSLGVLSVIQILFHFLVNLAISAYALYVGFKFKADPSAVCRVDAQWLTVHGFSYIVWALFPLLLQKCSGTGLRWGASFYGALVLFQISWGIYGISLFFHSEAQKCNRELYLFGYVIAILCLVGLSIMCCSLPKFYADARQNRDISFGSKADATH